MQVYDRFPSNEEIRSKGELGRGLRRQITLFRFKSGPVEAVAHGGVLSLKGATSGRVAYGFARQTFETSADRVLLVPEDGRYTTRIGEAGATILSLYFPRTFAAAAYRRAIYGDASLLDQPDTRSSLQFPAHLRAISPSMRALFRLLAQARSMGQLQSAGFYMLEAFVATSLEASGQWRRAPAARPSVRAELFRRVSAARDVIEENLHRVVPLEELAVTCCLSSFHLHRVFASVFGETPADMSRRRRLETAQALLAANRLSIERVAAAVGFENGSAFGRAFRAACGVSPSDYRRAAAS